MHRTKWLLALGALALMLACWPAHATEHAPGSTVQSGTDPGQTVKHGTKWRQRAGTAGGAGLTSEETPLSEILMEPFRAYYDTLSLNGRQRDSLLVPVDVHNFRHVTLAFKTEGQWGDTTGVEVRLAVAFRWHPGLVVDSTTTWTATPAVYPAAGMGPDKALPDSVGLDVKGTVQSRWTHEVVFKFLAFPGSGTIPGWPGRWRYITLEVPGGVRGLTWTMRLLSAGGTTYTGTTANGSVVRIRADVVGSAL